jgi:hypothetical protein
MQRRNRRSAATSDETADAVDLRGRPLLRRRLGHRF